MWFISFRDLQYRQRRFLIAVAGTALVFAMSLIGSGMSAAFRTEVERTMDAIGADAWLIPAGAAGPFTSFGLVPTDRVVDARALPGVRRADPLIVMHHSVPRPDGPLDVNVIGYRRIGRPPVWQGRLPERPGEVVIDASSGLRPGDEIPVGPVDVQIVGITRGLTFNAGTPTVYARIGDVQTLAFQGQDVATAIVARGVPKRAPSGMQVISDPAARADLLRPFLKGIGTIDLVRLLLWIVAGSIIGAIVYLSSLERMRDFAVLRAVGTSGRALFAGLALQAMIVALLAAVLSIGVAHALVPLFPLQLEIPGSAYVLMPAIAVSVGLVASTAGLRRTMSIDPALAFGGP